MAGSNSKRKKSDAQSVAPEAVVNDAQNTVDQNVVEPQDAIVEQLPPETATEQASIDIQSSAEESAEVASVQDEMPSVEEKSVPDEQPVEDELKDGEQSLSEEDVTDEQSVEGDKTDKPVKAPGKKIVLNKKTIIILSCVLAIVIIGVILAVCLTSCNGNDKNKQYYTVTFMVDDTVFSSQTLQAGEKITRPASDPTKEMFIFDDWYLDGQGAVGSKQKFVFDTVISKDIVIVAGWRGEVSVKVELDANGGQFAEGTDTVLFGKVGADIDITASPTRTGYLFGGWFTDVDCTTEFTQTVFPESALTLFAQWKRDPQYVYITYYGNGQVLRVDPVKKGDDITVPDLFDEADLVVGDWCTNAQLNNAYTPGKADQDLDLFAAYYTRGLEFDRNTVKVYNGMSTRVVVPSYFNGRAITAIGADAFNRTSELPAVTSVKLPDTITKIGDRAFYNCQYLAEIDLTDKVETIGEDAFYRNVRLRSVGDISGLTSGGLGAGAFNGCQDLREVTISDKITEIGAYTFNDCKMLADVRFSNSLLSIGEYAFSGCVSLKTVVLDSMIIQAIGSRAFADCDGLTDFTITRMSGAVSYDDDTFANSRNITIYVPSTLVDTYKSNAEQRQLRLKFSAIG